MNQMRGYVSGGDSLRVLGQRPVVGPCRATEVPQSGTQPQPRIADDAIHYRKIGNIARPLPPHFSLTFLPFTWGSFGSPFFYLWIR